MSKKGKSRRPDSRPRPTEAQPTAVAAPVAQKRPKAPADAPRSAPPVTEAALEQEFNAKVEPLTAVDGPPTPLRVLWKEHWRTVCVLFALSLVVRAAVLVSFARTPFADMLAIDMKSYNDMALKIAGGEWAPTVVFYQSPFYSYFLGTLYKLFGTSFWVPRIANALLGAANVVLLYGIGVRLFPRPVPIIAALTLMVYGPLLLEETGVLKTAVVIFCFLLALALFLRNVRAASRSGTFVSGMMLGVAVVAAGQLLVAIPALAAYTASRWASGSRELRLRLAAIFVCGALLPMLPVVAWNTHSGGGFLLTSADAGLNLYLGNNPRSTGLAEKPPGLRDVPEYEPDDAKRIAEKDTGHPLTMAQVSRYWSGRAVAYMGDHPGDFVEGLFRKTVVLWNGYDVPDDYHYAFVRDQFMPILWACPTFGIIGPFALVGLLVYARRFRPLAPLYLVCLAYLGILVLFYVRGRYRMAAVPLLILFAAAGGNWVVTAILKRRWTEGWVGVGLTLVSVLFVNHTSVQPARNGTPSVTLGGRVWFDDQCTMLSNWYLEKNTDEANDIALAYMDKGLGFSRDSNRIAGLYSRKGQLSWNMAKRAIEKGDRGKAMMLLGEAERALQECVDRGYRVSTAEEAIAGVKKDREALLNPNRPPAELVVPAALAP